MEPRPPKPIGRAIPPRPDTDTNAPTVGYEADGAHAPAADALPAPAAGGVLGPYRLLGVLGRGGMGAVYHAHDSRLDRELALKVLLPELAADPLALARFRREAQAQAKVEHDHIITIHSVEEVDGVTFLTMPLLRGQTLAAALKLNPRPPVGELVRVARETAEGLAAAHAVGLIHRDIKPGNIWLESPKRRVKVLDFGLACRTGATERPAAPGAAPDRADVTAAGAVIGTPAYMSPEQADGAAVDHRTDLWSLGVVLYEMTTGKLPFAGANTLAVLKAVARANPIPVPALAPELPPALSGLIARLLAKNPTDRPPSAAAVAEELAAVERGLIVLPVQVFPLVSVSDAPAGPNPWDDINATEPTEVVGTSRREREDTPTRAAPPKWVWFTVGALALVAALAVFSFAVPWWKPKAKEVVVDSPAPVVPKPPAVAPPKKTPVPGAEQRALAEWVLKQQGGRKYTHVFVVRTGSEQREQILDATKLPAGPFTVTGLCLDTILPEHVADLPAMFGALGDLYQVTFHGPAWTDERLATAIGALKGKQVGSLKIQKFPEPLTKTAVALRGLKAVDDLELITDRPDGIPLVAIGMVLIKQTLELGGDGLTNDALTGFDQMSSWPRVLVLGGNVGDGAIVHIRATQPSRAFGKMEFRLLKGTTATEAGVSALADRFPETKVVWPGGTVGPKGPPRRRAIAEKVLARGGVITVTGNRTLSKAAELLDDTGINEVTLATGSHGQYTSAHWYNPVVGTVKEPFGDGELGFLNDLPFDLLYLHGQKLTDAGAAKLATLLRDHGSRGLFITNCDVGDETARAAAQWPNLLHLSLNDTKVTDAGVEHLGARSGTLSSLRLANTGIGDGAVPALSWFVTLSVLDLHGTKVTADGAKKLRAALPYTRIRDAGGAVTEPKPRPARDAAVAELFARGAVAWSSGTPIADPAKFSPHYVTLRFMSGGLGLLTTPANGWEVKGTDAPVTKPFTGAELVVLFTEAKIVDFRNLQLYQQNVTDDDLVGLLALPALRTVAELTLVGCPVGDATAARAAAIPALERLQLNDTKVTDAGAKRIADLRPDLTALRLRNCAITDATVPDLKKLKLLTVLDLKGTQVSETGAKEIAAALPKCHIRYGDGKVIAPK